MIGAHKPTTVNGGPHCECGQVWPCATVRGEHDVIDITQLECPSRPGATHHLQPRAEPGHRATFIYRCAYCQRSGYDLRQEAEENR